jgi:hypothetical protein
MGQGRWFLVAALAAASGCSSDPGSGRDAGAAAVGDPSTVKGSGGSSGTGSGSGGSFANSGTGGNGGVGSGGSSGTTDAGGTSTNQTCATPGTTRLCCPGGTETCGGSSEFPKWGPCLDAKGVMLTCSDACSHGEFSPGCIDSGTKCGPGEFGPGCDAGTDSGSGCRPGDVGPGCDAGPPPALCTDPTISNEPEILAAYEPASGQSIGENGQIKVWINDERAPIIAPNEQIDPNTGIITMPGDRTAKAADGYLWEPALYIAPQTAENGGTPHFPQAIKGWYNNVPPPVGGRPPAGAGVQVPGMDPPPAGVQLPLQYSAEDIWDVKALGLQPGTYIGEFVIHDGDRDRAVGCVTIVITASD